MVKHLRFLIKVISLAGADGFYIKIPHTVAGYENRPTLTKIVSVGLDSLIMRFVLGASLAEIRFFLAEAYVSQRDAVLINTCRPYGRTFL